MGRLMNVFVFANEKGGVGKSFCSRHAAAKLAHQYRVLLIDADSQGHAAHQLNVPEFGGLYRLLVQEAEWKEVLREPDVACWSGVEKPAGRLLLLPSNLETRVIPMMISNPLALRDRLSELKDVVDVVVIDTSPTPSLLHSVIYHASHAAVVPTTCESLSLDGLAKSTLHLAQGDESRKGFGLPGVQLIGVQPTMWQNTNAHNYGLDLMEQHFGVAQVWRPLAMRTVCRDSEYAKRTLFAYAPGHIATREIERMVKKVEAYVA